MTEASRPWWTDRTAYQIYPRSFADGNGDGIGDIPGILSRLDHLADLGVGILWLSPVYQSPMIDNGYDISDYRQIAPEFGTLGDLDRLIEEAGRRDIRIVMDLVVNHTSDRHPWFEEALRGGATRDYYVWRDPAPDGGPPNGMRAYFGGSAWHWHAASEQYYLHFFAPEQPDLNWENPQLRAEIYDMMRWWRDRGIGGFRMDVIDHIGKVPDRQIATDGPRLHDYLREMHDEVLAGSDLLTIGEAWSVTPETALLYTGRDRGELDMMFQFAHITEGWHPEGGKWHPLPFDLPAFKRVWFRWQEALADDGWNALFLSNHDLPRQVSRYGDGSPASAKALATAMHLMKGTPFVYQGEEIGMTNAGFGSIDDYRDLETLNLHEERTGAGTPAETFLEGARANSRDNARTPMQWDAGPNAGFGQGVPWIGVNANYETINVAAQKDDPASVLAHHRRLIELRKVHPVIVEGSFVPTLADHPQIFAYERRLGDDSLHVIVNLSKDKARATLSDSFADAGSAVISTHGRQDLSAEVTLAPWEAVALLENGV